jgi:hypothetical protein
MAERYKLFLLPAYVVFETTRAILTYAATHSHAQISSTFITFSAEVCKAIFATAFLCRFLRREHGYVTFSSFLTAITSISNNSSSVLWSYGAFAIPAFLYFVNNLLYLIGLQLTTPSLLHVTVLAKLPITAVLHHLLVKRQHNSLAWISLSLLCLGLLISNIPEGFSTWLWASSSEDHDGLILSYAPFIGPFIGLAIAIISGWTSIYTEVILKQKVAFWVAQFWLYAYGALFGGIALTFWDGRLAKPAESALQQETYPSLSLILGANLSVIASTAGTGLVVANILRKKDNLVKLVGTSASLVTITLTQCILFADLRSKTWTVQTIIGTGIIAISTWTYHYYKQQPPRSTQYERVPDAESSEQNEGKQSDGSHQDFTSNESKLEGGMSAMTGIGNGDNDGAFRPTLKRISFIALCVALLALTTTVNLPQKLRAAVPQNSASNKAADDIERFFIPHNVTPAIWGKTENPVRCVEDWVEREGILPSTDALVDWEETFLQSGCPVYPTPKGGLIFHQYWRGLWRPFNSISVEAFLATQRLSDGHKLIYWYEDGGPPEDVRQRFGEGAYAQYVEFREFNREKEAAGYCVESMPEWNDLAYQQELEMQQSTLSDIIRYVLLARYGGVWLDADTIPLRDLTPMIRSGPSACGMDQKDQWNNNILVFGPPGTGIAEKVLETTCSITYNETAYKEREGNDAIMPNMWWWLYNDGVFKTCELKTHCGVNRHPIAFTDGVYFGAEGQPSTKPCDDGELYLKGSELPATLHGLWTWHARLGQRGDECVEVGRPTLIAAVRRRILELLDRGLAMRGRDILPGPGFVSR